MNFLILFYIIFFFLNLILLVKINFLANYFGLIDYAKDKPHFLDTPKFGFFISLLIIISLFLIFTFYEINKIYFIITIYIGLFSLIGYLDDKFNLAVKTRILISLIISIIFFSYNPNDYFVSVSFLYIINILLLIFFTLGFIHLINITDGMNGLIPSLFLYSCIYYFFKGYEYLDIYFQILIILSILSISVFIIPNFLGITFLGNSGSYFISIIISLLFMDLYSKSILEYSDILMIFYIPLIDGIRVTIKRIYNKQSPFKGDLNHIHHMIKKKIFKFIFFFILFLPSLINFFFQDFTIYICIVFFIIYSIFYLKIKNLKLIKVEKKEN